MLLQQRKDKKMDDIKILYHNPLFNGISEPEIAQILNCLKALKSLYAKDEYVYRTGDDINAIGIVLSGSVHILQYDIFGNSHIIQRIASGGFFAETYACQQNVQSLVNVIAVEDSNILFVSMDKLLKSCHNCCPFHQKLIENLIQIIAKKNFNLIRKIELLTPRSLRERIIIYLSQTFVHEGDSFDIPFNRQQLADYLSVDRSALSAELSKMQKEGLIEYHKNHFKLKLST